MKQNIMCDEYKLNRLLEHSEISAKFLALFEDFFLN